MLDNLDLNSIGGNRGLRRVLIADLDFARGARVRISMAPMSTSARLLFAGMLLFLIGLASGLAAGLFHNPRLAVSGHLEGVLNGMFLLIVGLLWHRLALKDRAKKIAFALLVFGAYANWALTMLGAAWGTKKLTPIAGAGYEAAPWQETAMTVGLSVMVVAMVVGVGILAWGLRRELTPSARG